MKNEVIPMRITYSKSADAANIFLVDIKPGGIAKTHPCLIGKRKDMINLDFDKDGRLVSIEIMDASEVLPAEVLRSAKQIG